MQDPVYGFPRIELLGTWAYRRQCTEVPYMASWLHLREEDPVPYDRRTPCPVGCA
jgi:hypothetical protein